MITNAIERSSEEIVLILSDINFNTSGPIIIIPIIFGTFIFDRKLHKKPKKNIIPTEKVSDIFAIKIIENILIIN